MVEEIFEQKCRGASTGRLSWWQVFAFKSPNAETGTVLQQFWSWPWTTNIHQVPLSSFACVGPESEKKSYEVVNSILKMDVNGRVQVVVLFSS